MSWSFYNTAGFLKVNTGRELVSTLPSSPVDGQEVFYQSSTAGTGGGSTNSMADVGNIWHLRYRAASASAYKWEFVGGSQLYSTVVTGENTTSTSYAALTTAGPSVTLPLAGDYDIKHGFRGYCNTTSNYASMTYDIGGAAGGDSDFVIAYMLSATVGGVYRVDRTIRKTSLSAVTLTAKYKTTAGTSNFENRQMEVRPIRVG